MEEEIEIFGYLGRIIRDHRKYSGLTQGKLAQLAGVGKSAVFDVEHGKTTTQIDTLLKILKVLNIKMIFSGPLMPSPSGDLKK